MTTHEKDLAKHAEAMGFEVPATATAPEEPVDGELIPDFDGENYVGAEYSGDVPEHGSEELPIHRRSWPKVALVVGVIAVCFGLPAYLFLSVASGGGGTTNTAKTDAKDKEKKGLQDPQSDEVNRLKTRIAIGQQLASASPSPSPSSSIPSSPTSEDKTTKPSPAATPAPAAPTTPIVSKTSPQTPPISTPAPASTKPSVAPLPVVQPKPLPSVAAKNPQTSIVTPAAQATPTSVGAKVSQKSAPTTKAIAPSVITPSINSPSAKADKPLASPSTVLAAKPNPKPIDPPAKTSPVLVKAEPKVATLPPVTLASVAKAPVAPISWEQASSLGVYGGDSSIMTPPVGGFGVVAAGVKDTGSKGDVKQQSKYEGALSPNLLLAAGTNVKGHTLAPYAVGISAKNQSEEMPLSIALDESIELGKGYRLPVGTTIHFVASIRDNGSVIAISKNADLGGVEISLPERAITLAAENNGLLMAKEITTGGRDLARADINSSLWGAAAGAGKAILNSGGQTTTNTGLLGTTTTQTNSGNLIGGILDGAFSSLAANGQRRAQQAADRIEQQSKLNSIDVGTKVKLFFNVPINIQIPVSGQQAAQLARAVAPEDDGESQTPPQLIASNSVPAPQEEAPPPPLPQAAVAVQPAAGVTPAPLSPQAPPVVQAPVVIPLQPTRTPLPLNPPKTRISIP